MACSSVRGGRGRTLLPVLFSAAMLLVPVFAASSAADEVRTYAVPAGAHPHDVAPAADGSVWYTAQRQGALGGSIPPRARSSRFRSGAAPRRTASSWAGTALPGSPTAA